MFKKTKEPGQNDKSSRQVVTETVEKKGGMQTKTTTITCTEADFDSAFKKLNLDPEKFRSGGTSVTRQIIYTNSSGHKEVMEETVETYGDNKEIDQDKNSSGTKSFAQKLGFGSTKSPKAEVASATTSDKGCKAKSEKAGKFEEDCLQKHNEYRLKHGVPKLKLSKEMCSYAKEWAENLAATDSFKHRSERKYGENIYMKWSSDPNHSVTGEEAVDSWYSEIKDYTFGQEPRSLGSGHFTQVIWKESKNLGVAWARSKTGKVLVVANYEPAGNFVGRFTENVPPPKK